MNKKELIQKAIDSIDDIELFRKNIACLWKFHDKWSYNHIGMVAIIENAALSVDVLTEKDKEAIIGRLRELENQVFSTEQIEQARVQFIKELGFNPFSFMKFIDKVNNHV